MISIIVLFLVFIFIMFRRLGRFNFEIWQVMLYGAIIDLLTFQISPIRALQYIDFDVIIFLFCMFILGSLLEISGYLEKLCIKFFSKSDSLDKLLFYFILLTAFLSAFFMNDTISIIGVSIIIYIHKHFNIPLKPLILTLAFSITLGSVITPIGNPQNLLIAISGIKNPFFKFIEYLFIPTMINLVILFYFIKIYFKDELKNIKLPETKFSFKLKEWWLYQISHLSVAILFSMIIIKIYFSLNGKEISLVLISIFAAIPALFLNIRQKDILKNVDYKTLIFFMSMFIVTKTAWFDGGMKHWVSGFDFSKTSFISLTSLLLSQLISNVPLVALFIPALKEIGASLDKYIILAVYSTIAGNLTILGAASNVIIIQNLQNKKYQTINSLDFLKAGLIFTTINSFIYYLFFLLK